MTTHTAHEVLAPRATPAPSVGAKPAHAGDNLPIAPAGQAQVRVRVELGRRWMAAHDVAELGPGSVVELPSDPSADVDVFASGRLAGRGELMVMEGKLAVRVLHTTRAGESA